MKSSLIICLLLSTIGLSAQPTVDDYTADVSSIENIVSAALASISGDIGEERDWDRFRHLFLPTAQLNAVFHKEDSSCVKVNTIDEFIEKAGTWYVDNGFREYVLKNNIDRFGHIAHVFQSYGASTENDGEIERGINSYQLVFDNGRWWIVNLIWDSEREHMKIPDMYLK